MKKKKQKFINRELSWLEFNQRVLDEANDDQLPLLERLKFLAITASNLDEFFMVRVGGLRLLEQSRSSKTDSAGMTPGEQLSAITSRTLQMVTDQYRVFREEIEPQLEKAGIARVGVGSYSSRQAKVLEEVFENELAAIYSPQAVTSRDDFPLIANRSLSILVRLQPEDGSEEDRYVVIPFGPGARRIITLHSAGGYSYTLLEDVVQNFIDRFFPGIEVLESATFRITRNADMAVDDPPGDLLAGMEELLDARKTSGCVRLEIASGTTSELRNFLLSCLDADEQIVYECPGPINFSSFMGLADLAGFDSLRFEDWPPLQFPEHKAGASIFDIVSQRDVLLYHPYESFEPVVRLLEEAADDPDVLAIKQTLYRTSKNSPIVAALRRAAERGKHVTAIVELKARFDEARNIEWAKDLERASVQVFYGVKGLKTHAKVCIVVRREAHGIQRYVHFGTGNYNEQTSRLYSDVSLITCNDEFGADATHFFNSVTGYSQPQEFRKLEAAPLGMRDKLLEMIETETQRKKQNQAGKIVAKLNSLVDPQIIKALYKASQAGVSIRLNVRGICCLRPGVPGVSENIEVVSIVDRFLEHARIFYFYHGGDERIFISSADWMPRNLDRRVELLVPVEDDQCRNRLIDILKVYFQDNVKAKRLDESGEFTKVADEGTAVRSQELLYKTIRENVRQSEQYLRRTEFEPHRAAEH